MGKKDIVKLVFGAIEEHNSLNGTDVKQELGTALFGSESQLDSLDFVALIIDVEKRIEDQYGLVVSLTTEKAMSRQNSPFKTVETLTDYILTLVDESNINNGGK